MASPNIRIKTSEPSTHITPKAYFDDESVYTVDFTNKEERSWLYYTNWICVPSSGECKIIHSKVVQKNLWKVMHLFDRPPNVKMVRLRNPEPKVILVFGHDTRDSASSMMCKLRDVKSTVLTFLRDVNIPVEDIEVRVLLTNHQPAEQQNKGDTSLYKSTPDGTRKYTWETTWFCKPDTPCEVDDNATSQTHFSKLWDYIRRRYRSFLNSVWKGSVIFTVYHENIDDAMEMISTQEEVRAMMLECLQGIDSKVKDIQMEVQLRQITEQPPLRGPGHPDESCVKRKADDQIVAELKQRVSNLEKILKKMKRKERARMSGTSRGKLKCLPRQPPESSLDLMAGRGNPIAIDEDTKEILAALCDETLQDIDVAPTPKCRYRGDSDLLEASRVGNLDLVRMILAAGHADVNCRGDGNKTPVMLAAQYGHRDVVEILVWEGADMSLVDDSGDNILHIVSIEGDVETLKFVLSQNVVDINSRGRLNRTPVMWAAGYGHREVVKILVCGGADVSLVDHMDDNTLHFACKGVDVETVKYVLSLNKVDIDARNKEGKTATDTARDWGRQEVVNLLVTLGTQ